MNKCDIVDINDFLEQYGLSQCEADSLSRWVLKNNKNEIFKLFKDHKVSADKYDQYYDLLRKEVKQIWIIKEVL